MEIAISIYFGYKDNDVVTGLGSETTVPHKTGYNDRFILNWWEKLCIQIQEHTAMDGSQPDL